MKALLLVRDSLALPTQSSASTAALVDDFLHLPFIHFLSHSDIKSTSNVSVLHVLGTLVHMLIFFVGFFLFVCLFVF